MISTQYWWAVNIVFLLSMPNRPSSHMFHDEFQGLYTRFVGCQSHMSLFDQFVSFLVQHWEALHLHILEEYSSCKYIEKTIFLVSYAFPYLDKTGRVLSDPSHPLPQPQQQNWEHRLGRACWSWQRGHSQTTGSHLFPASLVHLFFGRQSHHPGRFNKYFLL